MQNFNFKHQKSCLLTTLSISTLRLHVLTFFFFCSLYPIYSGLLLILPQNKTIKSVGVLPPGCSLVRLFFSPFINVVIKTLARRSHVFAIMTRLGLYASFHSYASLSVFGVFVYRSAHFDGWRSRHISFAKGCLTCWNRTGVRSLWLQAIN